MEAESRSLPAGRLQFRELTSCHRKFSAAHRVWFRNFDGNLVPALRGSSPRILTLQTDVRGAADPWLRVSSSSPNPLLLIKVKITRVVLTESVSSDYSAIHKPLPWRLVVTDVKPRPGHKLPSHR